VPVELRCNLCWPQANSSDNRCICKNRRFVISSGIKATSSREDEKKQKHLIGTIKKGNLDAEVLKQV